MLQITGIDFPGKPGLAINGNTLSVGYLVSRVLTFSIIAAGLFFFVRLLSAGFSFLTSAGDSGKISGATKELTNAAIGLVLVIVSFFIAQVLQVVFGISILTNPIFTGPGR